MERLDIWSSSKGPTEARTELPLLYTPVVNTHRPAAHNGDLGALLKGAPAH